MSKVRCKETICRPQINDIEGRVLDFDPGEKFQEA